jgi:MYXO-CTERM domain-containing protein
MGPPPDEGPEGLLTWLAVLLLLALLWLLAQQLP